MTPREELDQIATEIKRLEARQRAIYAESLRAAEADKVVEDWVAEMLAEPSPPRMRFPIEVHDIESSPTPHLSIVSTRRSVGSWVAVRPCGAEWKGKTLLGIYIGDVALYPSARWEPASKTLFLDLCGHNPGIYVPAAKRVVYGCESWWGVLKSPDDLKQITDDDINSIWYVQALKALTATEAIGLAQQALADDGVQTGPVPDKEA